MGGGKPLLWPVTALGGPSLDRLDCALSHSKVLFLGNRLSLPLVKGDGVSKGVLLEPMRPGWLPGLPSGNRVEFAAASKWTPLLY